MLIGTDWEDEGALRLYRSTTKETKEQVSDSEPWQHPPVTFRLSWNKLHFYKWQLNDYGSR